MRDYTLLHGDCIEEMRRLETGSVDMVLTSPPYDDLRDYSNSLAWNYGVFCQVAASIYRVLSNGGIAVWVVADKTKNGSESGSSMRQALHFKELGFNLHDTMIYAKNNVVPLTHNRYEQAFEYMFILSKGKPKTFNPIDDKPNKDFGRKIHGTQYIGDKTRPFSATGKDRTVREFGRRHNIFRYNNQGQANIKHPAIFPTQLAIDHIKSWSNEGDTVLDPFMGSGTTGLACVELDRNFIGIEKVGKYFNIAKERINEARNLRQPGHDREPLRAQPDLGL